MNRTLRLLAIQCGLALLVLTAPSRARAQSPFDSPKWQALAQQQILDATKQFYLALNGVLTGDLDLISQVWSHKTDVTNLSSAGGRDNGWNEIFQRYQTLVRMQMGGKIVPQDIVVVADGEMGYSICTESGDTRTSNGSMQNYTKRATNIFRLEDGKWKLIHHHTDPVQILEP
ncbi:MAG TPA: nuclear transport factor 2 family protein [Candidatus Binataceae bacterium]|nr:nuclear transport factor 2 family protein [Candidatus Binataceae bacterium]